MNKLKKFMGKLIDSLLILGFIILFAVNVLIIRSVNVKLSFINGGIESISYYLKNFDSYEKFINKAIRTDVELFNAINKLDVKINQQDIAFKEALQELREYTEIKSNLDEYYKRIGELKLLQIAVSIINLTEGVQGTGITILHNGQYYILSAGHLVEKETDNIWLYENYLPLCKLKIIKLNKDNDLLLLTPENKDIKPSFYTELAINEPIKSEEIYIVGNPLGIEDFLSEGRIIEYKGIFIYFYNHTFFGSSGGGIFNKDGKLVGIISFLKSIDPNPFGIVKNRVNSFLIYGAVRLLTIKEFLRGI